VTNGYISLCVAHFMLLPVWRSHAAQLVGIADRTLEPGAQKARFGRAG